MAIYSNCLIVLNYPFGWIFFAPTKKKPKWKKNENRYYMRNDGLWFYKQ